MWSVAAIVGLAVGGIPTPGCAWAPTGHLVVGEIAWRELTPEVRAAAVTLLNAAPDDSDLPALMPQDDRPPGIREREFFRRAGTWADMVREEAKPERRAAYHRPEWHYINWFWRSKPDGPADVSWLQPGPTNVVERLQALVKAVRDQRRPSSERAIDLAWVLHLIADIHQPLHTSARVTDGEPRGDAGGNLFMLDGDRNLHAYWDTIADRSVSRRPTESEDAYIIRIADLLARHHQPGTLRPRIKPGQYEAWGRESLAIARSKVYPVSLARGTEPSPRYRRTAWAISAEQLALAGHRLATVLQEIFGR